MFRGLSLCGSVASAHPPGPERVGGMWTPGALLAIRPVGLERLGLDLSGNELGSEGAHVLSRLLETATPLPLSLSLFPDLSPPPPPPQRGGEDAEAKLTQLQAFHLDLGNKQGFPPFGVSSSSLGVSL